MIQTKNIVLIILGLLVFIGNTIAQDEYVVKRLSIPLQFDGRVEDSEWQGFKPLPLTMHAPTFGGDLTEETQMYLGYDEDYLYLAGRLYYKDINDLQSTSKKRDAMEGSTEYFGIIIDSFNDNENGLGFFTTPSGLRTDIHVFNDAQGEFPVNVSWNTFWDVKTTTTDEGWFAEIRIPFTSLRFQDKDGVIKMGVICWRYMPSKVETQIFPSISNDLGTWSAWKPSRAKEVIFKGIYAKKAKYIAPYLLLGMQQDNELNATETAYEKYDDLKLEAGLDVKYSLSSNFTMDLTINPDFAQVEADDQQVNLTRFSLFFPEKRLFFQERSSIFDVKMGGPNRFFYSRRIGLVEDEPVRIFGGARIVGRSGPWDLGFLTMQTERVEEQSSTNYSVFRVRKQTINQYSYLGGIVTNMIGTDGKYNTGAGLDGVIRMFGDDYLDFTFAQTYYNDTSAAPFSLSNAKLRVNWETRSSKGLGYDVGFSRVGEYYNPEMGFELRENYSRIGDRIWWGWIPGENSWLQNHQVFFKGSLTYKNSSLKTESSEIGGGWQFASKSAALGVLSYNNKVEFLTDTFEIADDVYILPGNYEYSEFQALVSTPFSKPLVFENMVTIGDFFDGKQLVLSISPTWKVSSSFELGANYIFNKIDFSSRNQNFKAHIARVRSTLMFSTKLSASLFAQYSSAESTSIGNIRIRYNPKEGNDLYLVFNQTNNSDREREFPTLPLTDSRTFLIKYTYTFITGNRPRTR